MRGRTRTWLRTRHLSTSTVSPRESSPVSSNQSGSDISDNQLLSRLKDIFMFTAWYSNESGLFHYKYRKDITKNYYSNSPRFNIDSLDGKKKEILSLQRA